VTSLKEINFGINSYCGPAVLSALTGESTDRCAAVISAVSGKKEIKAVNRVHLAEALRRLRFDVKETDFKGSTLFGVLFRMKQSEGLYVVHVPHHVVAVEIKGTEIYICDNYCKTPLDIKQSARLMQKVELVLKVTPIDPPKFVRSELMVYKAWNKITINKKNIYERMEDNTEFYMGSFQYENESELKFIIEKLGELDD